MTPLARAEYERDKKHEIGLLELRATHLETQAEALLAEADELRGRIAALEEETLEDVLAEKQIDRERDEHG